MLDYVPYSVSKRKWCLLNVAFCRHIWHLITHEKSRQAVEAAEQWADGQITRKALKAAMDAAEPYRLGLVGHATQDAPSAAYSTASPSKAGTVGTAFCAKAAVGVAGGDAAAEEKAQCELIREVLAYPYRPVTLNPVWLTANVRDLARTIYEERAFERLPILADALMDAGCDNGEVLGHCRSEGPHVRGCWVVDLILGKE
jgi:hypothetical protein